MWTEGERERESAKEKVRASRLEIGNAPSTSQRQIYREGNYNGVGRWEEERERAKVHVR